MSAEASFIIIDLVQYLEAHPLAFVVSKGMSASHIGVAVDMTGSPDLAAFAGLAVVGVENILHRETGTSGTDKVAPATGNTAVAIISPEGVIKEGLRNRFGDRDHCIISVTELDHRV